jgi:hypothetical protein
VADLSAGESFTDGEIANPIGPPLDVDGSGKFDTPCERIQRANRSARACSYGLTVAFWNPAGANDRHACLAVRYCGESIVVLSRVSAPVLVGSGKLVTP